MNYVLGCHFGEIFHTPDLDQNERSVVYQKLLRFVENGPSQWRDRYVMGTRHWENRPSYSGDFSPMLENAYFGLQRTELISFLKVELIPGSNWEEEGSVLTTQ